MTGLLTPPDLETGSTQYARRFSGPTGAYLLDVQDRGLRTLVEWNASNLRTALDVGGGHGQLVSALLDLGLKTSVLGSSIESAEELMRRPVAERVQFQAGDLLALPFADQSFDLVTSIRLLAHIDNVRGLIDELCRVARQCVIVDYPTLAGANALTAATFPVKRLIEKDTRAYQSFWPATVARAFRRNGFRPSKSFKQFTTPMGLHRIGGKPVRIMEEGLRKIGVTSLIGNPVMQRFDRETCA